MTIERKVLALDQASVDTEAGTGQGLAAAFGNVDDGGDVILKGFFEPVIDDFLVNGFMSWAHRWDEPVAWPTKAGETDIGLDVGWQYHTTPDAQVARTITAERLAAGKSMGLSIGYEVEEEQFREDGVRLLIKASRLFEVGMVLVPMNRLAGVTDSKSVDGRLVRTPPDPDSGNDPGVRYLGRTYSDQSTSVFAELESWRERTIDLVRKATSSKEGRAISAARRERLSNHLVALRSVIDDLEGLLTETEPKGDQVWAMRARARLAIARAEYDLSN